MVELAQLARGCTLLLLAEVGTRGLVADVKGPDLPGALSRFINVERQCLQALGLERRAKPVKSLAEVLAEAATADQVAEPGQEGA